jgi:hypothetical protein
VDLRLCSGSNPTIVSDNASVVQKITTQRIAYRVFRIKNVCPFFKNALAYYNAGVVAVN